MKKYIQISEEEQSELQKNFLQEPDRFYEKAEMDQLKEALKKNYTERFFTMTSLMKMNIMLSDAKITSGNFTSPK